MKGGGRVTRHLLCCLHNDGNKHVEQNKEDHDVEGPEEDDGGVRRQRVPGSRRNELRFAAADRARRWKIVVMRTRQHPSVTILL